MLDNPHITAYAHERAPQGICEPMPLEQLFARLSNITEVDCQPCAGKTCPKKFGRAWSPVRIEGSRNNGNVKGITVAVFDLDNISFGQLAALTTRLEGYRYLIHSTHTHQHPASGGFGHHFLRLVMPLSREATPAEWPKVLAAAIHKLELPADPACKDLARLYFLPTRPRGEEFVLQRGHGVALDVGALLQNYEAMPRAAVPVSTIPAFVMPDGGAQESDEDEEGEDDRPVIEVDDDEDGISVADLRKLLVTAKKRKAKSAKPEDRQRYQVLCAILDGAPLALPGARSTTVNQAVSMITHFIPLDTAWEVVQELIRPAIAAMPCDASNPCRSGCTGNCCEHWLTVAEASYDRAMPRAKEHARENAERKQAAIYAQEALLGLAPSVRLPPEVSAVQQGKLLGANAGMTTASFPLPPPSSASPPGASGGASPGGDTRPGGPSDRPKTLSEIVIDHAAFLKAQEDGTGPVLDMAWRDLLMKSADGKIIGNTYNICIILSHTPTLKGTIRFNVVSRKIEINGGPFHGMGQDVFAIQLTNWLQRVAGLKVRRSDVEDQILVVAMENSYDPIKEYLEWTEKQWDGVRRLDEFFFNIVKVKTTNENGADISAHLRRIGPKVWISSVARIYTPGCQVDTMLVLEGLEGEGKTSFLRRMFGDYFITLKMSTDSKDAQMIPGENWGAEVAELHAIRRSDDAGLLSYLTETVDKYRPPYGRCFISVPRRNICIGTTNEKKWLTPGKGRRRYWPVWVEAIDLDAIALVGRDGKIIPGTGLRDQLWGEAVARFKAGERWWLTKEERAEADAEADARMEDSFFQSKIETWYFAHRIDKRPELVTLVQIVSDVLEIASERANNNTILTQVDTAMANLGFSKERREVAGRMMQVYVATREMRGLPSMPSYLRPVPNPPTTVDEGLDAIANAKPENSNGNGGDE